jgi:MFS family permease
MLTILSHAGVFIMNSKRKQPATLLIVTMAINAALYAVGSFATAYIPSPWGVGQFRPAVIIPAFFATIFGPWVGGIGAALGTLIADSVKHGQLYFGSLIAAVPGNFIGFFLFGYVLRKKFNWARFIAMTNVTLVIANLIVAFLYVFAFKVLYASAPSYTALSGDALTMLSIGLTIFWFVTMLPFVLLITPLLIVAVSNAFPSIVADDVRESTLKELPRRSFALSMLIPGIIMILTGLATSYTVFGSYLSTNFASTFSSTIMALLQLLFYGSGIVLSILGALVLLRKER